MNIKLSTGCLGTADNSTAIRATDQQKVIEKSTRIYNELCAKRNTTSMLVDIGQSLTKLAASNCINNVSISVLNLFAHWQYRKC